MKYTRGVVVELAPLSAETVVFLGDGDTLGEKAPTPPRASSPSVDARLSPKPAQQISTVGSPFDMAVGEGELLSAHTLEDAPLRVPVLFEAEKNQPLAATAVKYDPIRTQDVVIRFLSVLHDVVAPHSSFSSTSAQVGSGQELRSSRLRSALSLPGSNPPPWAYSHRGGRGCTPVSYFFCTFH